MEAENQAKNSMSMKTAATGRTTGRLTDQASKKLAHNGQVTVWVLISLLFSGVVIAVIATWSGSPMTALLWALACLVMGCLAGFLFAIPRVTNALDSKKSDEGVPAQSTSQSTDRGFGLGINTNLEEISDWLTKILVGLSLVEAGNIRTYLVKASASAGPALGAHGQVAAVGIIVFFSGLGFLSGYLLTRIFVGPTFRLADAATSVGFSNELEHTLEVAIDAQIQSQAMPDLYDVLDAAYAEMIDHRLTKSTLPKEVANSYINEFEKFRKEPRWQLNRRLHLLSGNMYKAVNRLNDAIVTISGFIEAKRANNQLDIHLAAALFNRACYYALEYADNQTATSKADLALKDLEESISICASNAGDAVTDPDFQSLHANMRFRELVGQKNEITVS